MRFITAYYACKRYEIRSFQLFLRSFIMKITANENDINDILQTFQ